MAKPKISIIANFYNSEKYIPKLIKSIQNQTFSDWELIAVNDCSPGKDSEILHRYAATDPRIRVIDNEINLGIARAKKVGIDASIGDYITFIDGDDWFEKDMLEVMIGIAESQGVELIITNYFRTYPLGIKKSQTCSIKSEDYNRVISWEEFRQKYYNSPFGKSVFYAAYWGKLYKGDVLRNFKYDYAPKEETYEEDTTFTAHLLPEFKSFYFSDYQGYNWRWGGITTGRGADFLKLNLILSTEIKRYNRLCLLIKKHEVPEGQYFLDIEFKNVLRYIIIGYTEAYVNDKKKALELMNNIFALPLASVVDNLTRYHERYFNDPFVRSFRNRNAEELFEFGKSIYKSNWKKRTAKHILFFFLKIF